MIRSSFASLRCRLWLLVCLALLPALGLILYSASEQRRHAALEVQAQALRLAQLASSDQERLIDGTRYLLMTLAQIPSLRSGDAVACQAFLLSFLKHTPFYANFGLADMAGRITCSAVPDDTPVNIADRRYFRDAVVTRDFAVGEHEIGRITAKATIDFGYPIADAGGRIQAVVFAALDLSWLNRMAADARLPTGAVLLVIDRGGTILARYPNPGVWVGKSGAHDPLFPILLTQGEGTTELPGVDGIRRLYAFTTLRGLPGTVYVGIGIPHVVAYAPVNRMLVRNLIGLGLVGVFAMVAAWMGGDVFILRRVQALVQATKRLSAGDLSARTGLPHGLGELSQLAAAFDEMAAALEQHQAQQRLEEELRRQNAALEAQNHRVQEINRLKTEFVSLVSHELRTPLTAIVGYIDLVLDGEVGRLGEKPRELLSIVKNNADRLVTLIDDLLDISRIEADKLELQQTSLDLTALIDDVVRLLRPQIEAKGQRLSLHLDHQRSTVWGDAERITQILTNLLSNAHKYTPAGGHIRVMTHAEGDWVEVEVQDTGIGFSPDEQAQLFTKFFRARHQAAHDVGGTGLGLAITRSLVEMHGGEITASGVPGQGSTFRFTLPAPPAARGMTSQQSGASSADAACDPGAV